MIKTAYKILQQKPLTLLILLCLMLTACTPTWDLTLTDAENTSHILTYATWETLQSLAGTEDAVPLEYLLYQYNYTVLAHVHIRDTNEALHSFEWPDVAADAWWLSDGTLRIGDEQIKAVEITGEPAPLPAPLTATLMDIAPTTAHALGLPILEQATGHPLTNTKASHVTLIFLDGFGYLRWLTSLDAGLVPHLATLNSPHMGLSVFPPSTAVASAAMLTGAPPQINGATIRGTRTTDSESMFDIAQAAGLHVTAIEGDALAFNLRAADITLSGDRDGNGSTDDNVLNNALSAIQSGMPDLLWVHFHGIDDAGHTYGPDAAETQAKIVEVDAAVGTLLAALPPDTLVLIFADHGMHAVIEEERRGNHGNLIAEDMLIPVWMQFIETLPNF